MNEWKEYLVAMLQEMIRRPSLSGQEKNVADYVEAQMKSLGFHEVERDHYGNVCGVIRLGGGGKRILLEGHMDQVDVSEPSKWTQDPFGAEIVGGKMYGRATSDMKGNLAASIMAAALLKENPKDLQGEIVVAASVHEECFEGVASQAIGERWKPDCVVIGEASSLNIKRGQRGRAEVVLETFGKPSHSSNPSVGLNAVKTMVPLLALLEERFEPQKHPVLGEGILELTDIISTPYPGASVVPEGCRVTFDRRLLVGETKENVLTQIQTIIDEAKTRDSRLEAQVSLAVGKDHCYTGEPIEAVRYAPGWLFPEDHWFVQAALEGLHSLGQKPELSHYAFCTNGSYYAGQAQIPTIGYGGSHEHLAHVIDEYIEIDQLIGACEGYQAIIGAVLK